MVWQYPFQNLAGRGARATAFAGWLLCGLLLAPSAVGAGFEVGDLYQGRTIVTGQGEEERRRGFAQSLADVLVKVSGDPRVRGDPGVAKLAGRAGDLVAEFHYRDRMAGIPVHDEQGTRDRPYDLTVRFHPGEIDAALRSLGRTPWPAPRPRIVVFAGVRHGENAYMLAGEGDRSRDMREALAAASWRFGMPAVLPSPALLAESGLTADALKDASTASLDATAMAAGGEVALTGELVWSDHALGWESDWRLASGGKTYEWRVSGVSFDAAFRTAIGGAAQILSGHGHPD